MADKKISAMTLMVSLDGTEYFVGVQGGVTERALLSAIAAYTVDTITGAATQAPATGHQLMGALADDTEKMFDLDALSTYIVDKGFTDADDLGAKPVLTDDVLLARANDSKKCTTAQLAEYVLDGSVDASATLKASIRNISGVTDLGASVAGTEHMLVVDGSTPKRATLAQITTFTNEAFRAYFTSKLAAAASDADLLYVSESGADKKLALSDLATYINTTISGSVVAAVFDGATDTPIDSSVWAFETTGGVLKKCIGSVLATYTNDELKGKTLVSAAVGDDFLIFDADDSSNLKRVDIGTVATYVVDTATLAAAVVTPILTDHLVLNQGGTTKRALVSALGTKLFDGTTVVSTTMRDDVMTFGAFADAGSFAGTEMVALDSAGNTQRTTLAEIAAYVHSDSTAGLSTYIDTTIANVDPVLDGDEFVVARSSASKAVTATVLYEYAVDNLFDETRDTEVSAADSFAMESGGAGGTYKTVTGTMLSDFVLGNLSSLHDPNWTVIDTGDYTSTPADADTITMSDTSLMAVGLPLKYTIGGTDYFGIVSAVVTNTSIDVRGATLVTGNITALYVGPPSRVVTKQIKIGGSYLIPWNWPADGLTNDILSDIGREYFDWEMADAYLVSVAGTHGTVDGVANPKINVKVAGSLVLTEDTNKGISLGAAGTWVRSSGVGINLGNYKIISNDAIEVLCTALATTDGEAQDLSIDLTFVLE